MSSQSKLKVRRKQKNKITEILYVNLINSSFHLARKYAWIFVCRHYLFREANSFPRASRNRLCPRTKYVQGQISERILAPNGSYRVCYPSNVFHKGRSFENWEIFYHVTCLDQSSAGENIMDYKIRYPNTLTVKISFEKYS